MSILLAGENFSSFSLERLGDRGTGELGQNAPGVQGGRGSIGREVFCPRSGEVGGVFWREVFCPRSGEVGGVFWREVFCPRTRILLSLIHLVTKKILFLGQEVFVYQI